MLISILARSKVKDGQDSEAADNHEDEEEEQRSNTAGELSAMVGFVY